MASNNVSVAVRIRPKLQKEQIDMCNICTRVSPDEPQVWLGHDKAFTFDYVFDIASHQFDVYDNCVRTLVDGCFEGFNATVLAYGQTGSGKTYTMGTGFDVSSSDDQRGIIPRAVYHLFDSIQSRKEEAKANGLPLPEFNVTAQFIEIYNEELIDLLCEKRRKGLQIRIHEDQKRGIILTGVENKTVSSAEDTLACLKSGSLFRTTGATLMNAESSRSHAIFTLFIKQSRVEHVLNGTDEADSEPQQELVTLTAKFNFVDLAGSERLSRTGAVGERAREGISINSGLLHLGNVISALGDRSKKSSHIPYRDSKLTRVLQDSLGGNSVTTMIACISPCDRDFVETLNTLRYANRAKNIKNKVVANQDSQTQLINELRRQLMQLQVENQELKQGKLFVKNDGELELNDVYLEKEMLQRDLNNANIRIKALNTRLEGLTTENISIRGKMAKLQISNGDAGSDDNESDEDCAGSLIKGYLKEINTLRSKVIESEYTISYYREQLNKQETKELNDQDQPIDIIERAKYEIELGKSRLFHMNSSINSADSNGNRFSEGNDNYDNNGDLSGDEDEVQDEFEKKMADQNAEIATLMEIISSKERLIEEAEAREKRIIELTNHYEQKISSFKSKIKQTEDERDSLISKYKRDNKEDHNSKRLKDDYDRRVAMLQSEVRKYEALKREHDKVLRNESSSKDQLKKLRQEIIETKKKRVQLMGEMRQQMNRHNKEMQKSKLVINKLTREDYKKDVKIRDLVVQSNQQKKLLQRRDEELKVLRRRVKPMSDRVAGRITHVKRNNHGHTPQKARNMWHNFEQKFNELVMLRISFDKEEKKLERYLAERQNNINIINTLKEDHVDGDLNTEYLDNLQVNIDYLSKCIEDSQNMIMQIEEDNFNIEQMFDNCDMSEIMYIVNNLANSAIIYAIRASEKDEELKEKDSKLATLWNENAYSNHLLNYMVSKNFDGEENGVYPPGAINPLVNVDPSLLTPAKSSNDNKFRRLTMTPSELLYQSSAMEAANQTFVAKQLVKVDEDEDYVSSSTNHDGHSSPKSPNGTFVVDKNFDSTFVKETNDQPNVPNDNLVMHQISDRMTQSLHVDHPPVASSNANHLHLNAQPLNRNGVPTDSGDLYRVPSAPSLNDPYTATAAAAANQYNGTPPGSPSINRRLNRDNSNSMASSITQDSDVFSRLTNTSSMTRQPVEYSVGRIEPASSSKGHNDKSFPLVCTHTVVGHRRSVLSVTATNEVLFSGSKDGTARIWDLGQGEEVFSLNDHPDSVNVVRYDEYNKLIFTCSKSIIKIWDPRQKPVNCVHTLCASGLMIDNVVNDSFIHDMRLSADGSTLFSATEKLVRIFDLRTFQNIGKLNTGHKSLVTCLAVDNEDLNDTRIVITGSKDHFVKVFELDGEMSGIHTPKITLNPPHFDGIEALRLTGRGQYLFSGGRDGCIRKWDLTRHRMAASLSNCHRDWVLALNTLPQTSILLSACRSGYLRVWNTEDCSPFGEIQAHGSAINDIATIPQVAFTASSDCQIHVWQHRETAVNDDSA